MYFDLQIRQLAMSITLDRNLSEETPRHLQLRETFGRDVLNPNVPIYVSDDILDASLNSQDHERVALYTSNLRMDYGKFGEGRKKFTSILRNMESKGYGVEDALVDSRNRSLLVVFSKSKDRIEAYSEFIKNGRAFRIAFGSAADVMRLKSLLCGDFYERHLLEDARSRYRGNCIIDVGANIGNHSLFFSSIAANDSMVYSFEPVPYTCGILKRNLKTNNLIDRAVVRQCAVGAEASTVRMDAGSSKNLGAARIVSADGLDNPMASIKGGEDLVNIYPLDSLIPAADRIDILKIDVEGHELEVLKGATRILQENSPSVYIESGEGERKTAIDSYMKLLGYEVMARFNDTPTYLYAKS